MTDPQINAAPDLLDAADAMGRGSASVVDRLREQRAEIDQLRSDLEYAQAEVGREREARIYANQIYAKANDEQNKARVLLERAAFGDRADDIDLPTLPLAELVRRVLDVADERENLRRNLDRSRRRSVEIAEQMQADHNKTRAAIRTALADLKVAIDGNTTVRGMAEHAERAYRTLTASLAGETFDV